MDTTPLSRASPINDVIAPRAVATKAPAHAENPPEKVVKSGSNATASNSDAQKQQSEAASHAKPELDGRYVDIPDTKTFAYRVIQEETQQVVIQIPSEQAVKLRAYLQQKERAETQRREDAQNDQIGIVA